MGNTKSGMAISLTMGEKLSSHGALLDKYEPYNGTSKP